MIITTSNKDDKNLRPVKAASAFEMTDDLDTQIADDDVQDTLDDMQDSIEDIQDTVDEVTEDDVDIEVDNNIENHYIAECDSCHGIFISAVVESDQEVNSITGICPLCDKETEQFLKWIIKSVDDDAEVII